MKKKEKKFFFVKVNIRRTKMKQYSSNILHMSSYQLT